MLLNPIDSLLKLYSHQTHTDDGWIVVNKLLPQLARALASYFHPFIAFLTLNVRANFHYVLDSYIQLFFGKAFKKVCL